jgi:gluconate 2-dehydrogenase
MALRDAHGIIGMLGSVGPALLACAPALEVVSQVSVGYDNVDLAALNDRGILLCNTPDVLTDTTADLALLLLLGVARRVEEGVRWIKDGNWTGPLPPSLYGVDLHHKTLGIVGMGRIGGAIARRAALGFSMRVLYTARSAKTSIEQACGAERTDLDALLQRADFVCVAAPLTPETRHLIGAPQLTRMKPTAFLVNIARGPIVDETALLVALQSKQIAGAGLDVFEREPLASASPLLSLPNVLALPHIGSATHETRHAMEVCAANNLIDALQGRKPAYPVNPRG